MLLAFVRPMYAPLHSQSRLVQVQFLLDTAMDTVSAILLLPLAALLQLRAPGDSRRRFLQWRITRVPKRWQER